MELPLEANASTPAEAQPSVLKLYSHWQVLVAAVIGSTLVGGVLLAINFKRLGQHRRAWAALGLGALAVPALMALGAVADAHNPGRSQTALPAISAVVCRWVATGLQGERYKANLATGGKRESWWKTVGWSVAGLLLLFVVVLALMAIRVLPE